jgi:HD superfamily phosphodiesterase
MTDKIIGKMINYFGHDIRRINHALKVYGFASCIVRKENLKDDEIFIVETTAILHDIGIVEAEKKYNSSIGKYQEIEGPGIAKEILSDFDIHPNALERICFIIGNHHSYQNIDGIDFQIIVEADFLVNIYEDDITKKSIESIRNNYFKTKTGISIIESVYI